MSFAFLYLVYDKVIPNMKEYIKNNNLYIHPKNKIDDKYKKYVIKNIVQTEWCNYSIVQATLNLLSEAFKNKDNEWFFLLSQDSYPIYDYKEFINNFNQLHHNQSIFNYKDKIDFQDKTYYKTSQWWILKRDDVQIILNNKYELDLKNVCPDEYYFLTILKWNNTNYKYTDAQIMYDVWLNNTIQKSPLMFNHILKHDLQKINKNKSLFIRKVTPTFNLNIYKPKKKLYVIYIGTETTQNIPVNDEFDIIILAAIKNIDPKIIERSIYIYNIIYKFLYETILSLCQEEYLKNWDLVIFTTEKFNLNNYNSLSKIKQKLPTKNLVFQNNNVENKEEFYYITDNNNNLAFCYKPK